MLFHIKFVQIPLDEIALQRALRVFAAWEQPTEVDIKGFYGAVGGGSGYAIVEASSDDAVLRMVSPFLPFNTFEVTAILPIEDAVGILGEAVAFRESVS